MQPDASAYAALGLRPGAGPVAIEAAYRRLIKHYHPDRGGDPARAAEINSAYQHLRTHFGAELGRRRGPPVPVRPIRAPKRRTRAWSLALIGALAVLAVSQRDAIGETLGGLSLPMIQPLRASDDSHVRAGPLVDLAQAPLDLAGIDRSVLDAARIAVQGEERLAEQSRACHRQLHRDPDPSRLDRCVAFDEAAVALLGHDAFDGGPFGASAVTTRHFGSGRLLTNDMLTVESRLNRVRTQVELSLAAPEPQLLAARPD